jgi:hypothetical protein
MRRKKKIKIFGKKELPSWKYVVVWKDFRPSYVSEAI